jgi:hypothetical protein
MDTEIKIVSEENNADTLETVEEVLEIAGEAVDNAVAIAEIEANKEVAITAIQSETAIAISENNLRETQLTQEESENQAWNINRLEQSIMELQGQVATLTNLLLPPTLSDPQLVMEAEAIAEMATEAEMISPLTPNDISDQTSETKTEASVESVSAEIPTLIVNEKPVRVPIIELV